jgi:choline dehydrogenase-like flavoprotein
MAGAGEQELKRAVRMLEAAQTRMQGSATVTPTVTSGHSREDGRLVCLVEATNLEWARRLVSVAQLPPGRIRQITHLAGTHLLGSHPGSDVDPRVESELVEDVVDVGFNGALGQE